jgi:hypothetical protein
LSKEQISLPKVLDHAFVEAVFAKYGKDMPPDILNLFLESE